MRFIPLLLCLALVSPLRAAESTRSTDDLIPPQADFAGSPSSRTSKTYKWVPGRLDGRIATTTATMLEQFHYLHLPFDAALSSKMLDVYLSTLDPQHIHFLQSDLAEFEKYRYTLGEMTKEKHDTTPAYVIFNRFVERLEERTTFAKDLLHNETFEYDATNHISLNRKNAPYPKDLDEAKKLWRERVRFEYLEEKLNRETPKGITDFMTNRLAPLDIALTGRDFHQGIVKYIDTRYNRILRNFHEWESDQVLETYLTSLARVYDPHSDYEDKDTLDNFAIQMSLSLFGIGAVLQSDDDGYCKIVSLQPGAPADKSKMILPGDRIVAVAQGSKEPVDVVQMPLTKVVALIRGDKGTKVKLTVIPADTADTSARKTVELVRDEIKLEDQQAKAKLIEIPAGDGSIRRLGVIDLPSFYASFAVMGSRSRSSDVKSCTVDVDRLLTKLEDSHVDGVILDLRHNGGGSLPEAIDLTGLFIKEGPVVQVGSSDGSVQVDEDHDDRVAYDGPLVVLTSRFSASASEIVAGALQDYGRALIVGGTTHGKGTVQSMSQLAQYLYLNGELLNSDILTNGPSALASLGALKYTTNKFYRITGSSTQLKGVTPDIALPSTYDYMETEEGAEEYAMKWDEIHSAEFEKLDRVRPYLPELQKRSSQRVASSKDFAYVREDIDIVKKAMADKSVSLNERQRLQETDQATARKKARDAELKARKEPELKIYDLTLKQGEVEMKLEPKPEAKAEFAVNPAPGEETTPSHTPHDETPKPVEVPGAKDESKPGATNIASQVNLTNSPASASATAKGPPEPPTPEEKAPLDEAEHILMDYIALLHNGPPLTAQHLPAAQ